MLFTDVILGRILWHQLFPSAAKCLLNPAGRGDQDIDFSHFDLLRFTDVQVHQLGKVFLRGIKPATNREKIAP